MLKEYHVIVREVHKTTVAVEASSPEDAIQKVWQGKGEYYPDTTFCYTMRPENWSVEDPEEYTPPKIMRTFDKDSGEFIIQLDEKLIKSKYIGWQPISTAPLDGTIIETKDDLGNEDIACFNEEEKEKSLSGWFSVAMGNLPTKAPLYWRPITSSK